MDTPPEAEPSQTLIDDTGGNGVRAVGGGQIEGGDILRAAPRDPDLAFSDPLTVPVADDFEIKLRISNPGPNPLGCPNELHFPVDRRARVGDRCEGQRGQLGSGKH